MDKIQPHTEQWEKQISHLVMGEVSNKSGLDVGIAGNMPQDLSTQKCSIRIGAAVVQMPVVWRDTQINIMQANYILNIPKIRF